MSKPPSRQRGPVFSTREHCHEDQSLLAEKKPLLGRVEFGLLSQRVRERWCQKESRDSQTYGNELSKRESDGRTP